MIISAKLDQKRYSAYHTQIKKIFLGNLRGIKSEDFYGWGNCNVKIDSLLLLQIETTCPVLLPNELKLYSPKLIPFRKQLNKIIQDWNETKVNNKNKEPDKTA